MSSIYQSLAKLTNRKSSVSAFSNAPEIAAPCSLIIASTGWLKSISVPSGKETRFGTALGAGVGAGGGVGVGGGAGATIAAGSATGAGAGEVITGAGVGGGAGATVAAGCTGVAGAWATG